MTEAVILDLDGVLIDSESAWAEVRRELVLEHGGRWHDHTQRDMMGMSSVEWSRFIHDELGVDMAPRDISADVVRRLTLLYRERLPLLPGAHGVVERLSARWPLAVASSSNRELIDLVLEIAHLGQYFAATVSSEEVTHGKPAPDVYLEAARRLATEPSRCAAVEDSHNGILSGVAAGMRVIAIPNAEFPPGREALAKAAHVLASLDELTPEVIAPPADRSAR